MIKYANEILTDIFFFFLRNIPFRNFSAEKSYFFLILFFFSASSIFNDGLLYSRLNTTQFQSSLFRLI